MLSGNFCGYIDDTSTWKPLKWIFYLCLVIMALGGLAFAYRFYMKKKA